MHENGSRFTFRIIEMAPRKVFCLPLLPTTKYRSTTLNAKLDGCVDFLQKQRSILVRLTRWLAQ